MDETEWLVSIHPQPMLEFVRGKASDRKLRLFACACCRTAWDLIPEELHRESLWLAERHADGQATDAELGVAVSALHRARRKRNQLDRAVYEAVRYRRDQGFGNAESVAIAIARTIAFVAAPDPSPMAMSYFRGDELVTESIPPNTDRLLWEATLADHQREMAGILRDIFGNPFRPVSISPTVLAWHDGTVKRLAQAAYDERQLPEGTLDNGRLAILADALEEAGCTDADILDHLRGPGPHVRGCWAVDLLLGKK